jgi:hypothetical protein
MFINGRIRANEQEWGNIDLPRPRLGKLEYDSSLDADNFAARNRNMRVPRADLIGDGTVSNLTQELPNFTHDGRANPSFAM